MKNSVWLRDRSVFDLELLCSVLNGEWPKDIPQVPGPLSPAILGARPTLTKLVEAWLRVDRNADRLWESDRWIAAGLERMTARISTKGGQLKLEWPCVKHSGIPTEAERHENFAFEHFVNLLLNPQSDRLAGPCARCRRFYVKKTAAQKVYCSRRCDQAAGAVAATTKRNEEARAGKLQLARTTVREWSRVKTPIEWKTWVVKREPLLSKTFLTQSVNRGELEAPKEKK
jgi:hypothetical protein